MAGPNGGIIGKDNIPTTSSASAATEEIKSTNPSYSLPAVSSINVVVVAGGGAGGSGPPEQHGGGGAGGMVFYPAMPVGPDTFPVFYWCRSCIGRNNKWKCFCI